MIASFLLILAVGFTVVADVAASAQVEKRPDGGHPGSRSFGISVTSDGEALDNIPVTIVNENTGTQVFSGYTGSAGQVDVTLPQGKYTVTVNGQQTKTVSEQKPGHLIRHQLRGAAQRMTTSEDTGEGEP